MNKIARTAKIGQGQFGCQRNSLNPIISKLDKHVVLLLISYIAREVIQFCVVNYSKQTGPSIVRNLGKL